MQRTLPMIALSALLLVGGCASDGTTLTPSQLLVQTDWRADNIAGAPVTIANPVTLSFNEGNASGRSGCNQYSGAADFDDRRITIRTIISTKMACAGEGVMLTESSYLNALQGVETFTIAADGSLTLTGPKASIHFVPQSRQIRPS